MKYGFAGRQLRINCLVLSVSPIKANMNRYRDERLVLPPTQYSLAKYIHVNQVLVQHIYSHMNWCCMQTKWKVIGNIFHSESESHPYLSNKSFADLQTDARHDYQVSHSEMWRWESSSYLLVGFIPFSQWHTWHFSAPATETQPRRRYVNL